MADIRIHLTSVQQLFDSLDPAPFRDKGLDRDAEAYLVEAAGELPAGQTLRLVVHGPESLQPSLPDIGAAIGTHFHLAERRLVCQGRVRRRIGRRALVLGLCVLALALLAKFALTGVGPGAEILGEGLLIVGWVGLWRPAEILLFDWLESSAERAVLRRLAGMSVEFTRAPEPAGQGAQAVGVNA